MDVELKGVEVKRDRERRRVIVVATLPTDEVIELVLDRQVMFPEIPLRRAIDAPDEECIALLKAYIAKQRQQNPTAL